MIFPWSVINEPHDLSQISRYPWKSVSYTKVCQILSVASCSKVSRFYYMLNTSYLITTSLCMIWQGGKTSKSAKAKTSKFYYMSTDPAYSRYLDQRSIPVVSIYSQLAGSLLTYCRESVTFKHFEAKPTTVRYQEVSTWSFKP